MKSITEFRGYFYLRGFSEDELPYWVTSEDTQSPYFHLNCTTRKKFAKDLLPDIKRGKILIASDVYNKIASYKALPAQTNLTDSKKVIEPQGISLLQHQLTAVNLMLTHNRFGFFMQPGTGKTFIAVSFLLSRKPKTTLIVTPKKVISQFQACLDEYAPDLSYDVINYESLHKVKDNLYECIILDESHYVKNYSSIANETLREMQATAKYVYLFTGTPADKSKIEIFPQLAILDNRYIPSKTKFNKRYYILDDYYNPKREKRILSDELDEMIQEATYGVEAEDVLDLPPEVEHTILCPLPEKYNELKETRVLNIEKEYEVIADTPSALSIKLRELCNGHIVATKIDTGEETKIKLDSVKTDKLTELLESLDTAIIYTQFEPDIEECKTACCRAGKTFTIVTGTSKNAAECIEEFKSGKVDCLIIQSRCGNAGLNLMNTNNIIFYAPPLSYINFYQCKCRIRRYGQTKPCNYYYLVCKNSIEEKIYRALKQKKSFSNKLMNSYN